MDDEKKVYSVVGQVTIGTDEYRDLIEGKFSAERDRDDYRSKYWHEQDVSKKAEDRVKAQEKAIALYREFVNADTERQNAYKLFLAAKQAEQVTDY